ncbi:hypothetical protein HMPREF1015_01836 [Bacillus smithii 7_3_47FAA]|jgi:hypothetical protein|uniref:Uncharacterized protein n=1 Tax=Bacillus smithii 7_3_47FAA TaxID=665952 RepID=G9QJF3_9BACI|nr:hypothetical protein HMPREF1015_01836 [Bacillus smithii 7_3_47FAA]
MLCRAFAVISPFFDGAVRAVKAGKGIEERAGD